MQRMTVFFLFFYFFPFQAFGVLNLELTRGVAGAIPIAVVPFTQGQHDISPIITNDLQNSGRFKILGKTLKTPNANYIVIGSMQPAGGTHYQINFKLMDAVQSEGLNPVKLSKNFNVSSDQLRAVAHRISDLIYQHLIGIKGIFSTRLAYVVVQRYPDGKAQYMLEVADQDGYNPRPILKSAEPIMSPAWSPNGRLLAYVSFENRRASIYVQDIQNGTRRLLSSFPGINGAPAWSPDGRKLALVLSKNGSPNIYIMDIFTSRLTQLTNDYYINTEPAWSPNGQSILYTSNRAGGPQIYKMDIGSNSGATRISFEGDYNARASYTKDGKAIAMIHRVDGIYHIALLNLETGMTRILSGRADDSSSPSIAPNDSMILYDTYLGGRNVLAMVSVEGDVQLRLPSRQGEAQDSAWSPYL